MMATGVAHEPQVRASAIAFSTRVRRLCSPLAVLVMGLVPVTFAVAQSAPGVEPAVSAESPVSAAEPAVDTGSGIQEIVVTATRRSELLSKVPISVSAFSQQALDLRGAKDFMDVVRFTPGVTLDANGTNNISIRGISSSAGSGTTGIYIDDTPIQIRALSFYSDDALPKAFDLERIEVLRGPQGTLFGAGAEGGAVRYIMTQPNLHQTSLYVRSEVAFTQSGSPSYEAGVAYGTPIVDNELGIRASIWYRRDGGWIDRMDPFSFQTTEENANYSDDVVLRMAAKWAVNDRVTVTPSVLYQNRRTNDITAYWPAYSNPNSDSYRLGDPEKLAEPDHYLLPALKIDADLGEVSLFSNTSFFSRRDQSGYSGTNYNLSYYQTFNSPGPPSNPNPGYAPMSGPFYPLIDGAGLHLPTSLQNYRAPGIVTNEQKTFTEELRLQSNDANAHLTWTAGLFYSVSRQTSIEEIQDPMIGQLFQTLFLPPFNDYTQYFGEALLANGDSFYSYNFSRDKQLAVFGEATYALTDKFKLTAGLRYSKTDVTFNNFVDGPQNFGPSIPGYGEQHEKPLTPKVSLAYQADRDNLFYATYAKGFRIGGANAPIPIVACGQDLSNLGLSAAPSSYDQDTVNSYELGSKNKLADHLRIASSVYYIRWQGIQQSVYLPICGYQFTANSGTAAAKGADVQLEFAPTASLSLDLAIGYTKANYTQDAYIGTTTTNLIAANGDAIEGASVTPAPPWTVALGIQYDFFAMDHKSFVRLDYEYASSSGTPTASEDPRTSIYDPLAYTPTATNFVSVRAGTTISKWSVSAFVDNLFDAHPEYPPSNDPHTGVDSFNPTPPSALIRAYSLRPRTIGITATYHL
jgi:iron complex outermembrane recepter protein